MNHVIFFLASVVLLAALSLRVRAPSQARRRPAATSTPRRAPPPAVAGLVRFDAPVPKEPRVDDAPMRSRMRDRYVAARFPGMLVSAADLDDVAGVVKIARLLFEEDHYDDAQELLQLAIGRSGSEPLRLARLEITFLRRDAARYVELARELRQAHPRTREWAEVSRLGRIVAPAEMLFGLASAERKDDRYGPWHDMPNWLQASWDFTPDALAAELHRDLQQDPPADCAREPMTSHGA